jgi:hypothetical protein
MGRKNIWGIIMATAKKVLFQERRHPTTIGRRRLMSATFMSSGLAMSGCGAQRPPSYNAGEIKTNSISQDDIASVGSFVLSNASEQGKYFGISLSEKNIVPIYIQIINKSTSNLLVDKDRIRVGTAEDSLAKSDRATKPVNEIGDNIVGGMAVVSTLLISPIAIVLMPLASKMASDTSMVKRNIVEKELYSRTLLPGEKAEGFIYMSTKDGKASTDGLALTVPVSVVVPGSPERERTYVVKL